MAKIEELIVNEEFAVKLEAIETSEELEVFLQENDVDFEELDEKDLDNVQGGMATITAVGIIIGGCYYMIKKGVNRQTFKDSITVITAFSHYKATGKEKYISGSMVRSACERLSKLDVSFKGAWNTIKNTVDGLS